jgi:hypothetical protein
VGGELPKVAEIRVIEYQSHSPSPPVLQLVQIDDLRSLVQRGETRVHQHLRAAAVTVPASRHRRRITAAPSAGVACSCTTLVGNVCASFLWWSEREVRLAEQGRENESAVEGVGEEKGAAERELL